MTTEGHFVRTAREDRNSTVVLVDSGLRMLVNKKDRGVVQQGAGTFRDRFELGYQIGKLLDVPAADVTENPLAFSSCFTRGLPILMGVIVVTRGGMAQPGKSSQALALGQHVAGNASLPGCQRI